jgi:propionate CoA-transferase
LELIEIAPGIDIERDILAQMEFQPIVRDPRPMDPRIFEDAPMGLRDTMLAVPLERRFAYDAEQNIFFVNFERLDVRRPEDIEAIGRLFEAALEPIGRKVFAVVNYDEFTIRPDLIDAWTRMIGAVVERHYIDVTRYTTSGFLRMRLGDALSRRGLAPHIYVSAEEARAHLGDT